MWTVFQATKLTNQGLVLLCTLTLSVTNIVTIVTHCHFPRQMEAMSQPRRESFLQKETVKLKFLNYISNCSRILLLPFSPLYTSHCPVTPIFQLQDLLFRSIPR